MGSSQSGGEPQRGCGVDHPVGAPVACAYCWDVVEEQWFCEYGGMSAVVAGVAPDLRSGQVSWTAYPQRYAPGTQMRVIAELRQLAAWFEDTEGYVRRGWPTDPDVLDLVAIGFDSLRAAMGEAWPGYEFEDDPRGV